MHAPFASSRPTLVLLALATIYAAAYRFIPYEQQAFFLWPLCALGLFSGARMKLVPAFALGFGVQVITDAIFYFTKGWDPVVYVYPCLLLNVVIGRGLLRHSTNAFRITGVAVLSFVVFFLVTNVGSWLHTALPEYRPHTMQTLLLSLEQGILFIRPRPGQWLGTPIVALLLFGADYALARATVKDAAQVR